MNPASDSSEPFLVITPTRAWWQIDWAELWHYRDLIVLFVRRDFVAYYKQTILGPLWFLLQPIMNTVVFTVIFGNIAHLSTDGLPGSLFYMSGTIAWSYFAACLNATSNTFITNSQLFGKVYFPRLCVPIAIVFSNILQFAIQFTLFSAFWIYFKLNGAAIHLSWLTLALPLVILQMAILSLGCGILVSSLTTRYRDLALAVGFGVQLWFYMTPIVYPLSKVPEAYQALYCLNPMVGVIEYFRLALLGGGVLNATHMLISLGVTCVLFVVGLILFHRVEKNFMDTV